VIKRTIEISREKSHLAVEHRQLLIKRDGQIVGQIPCEDIGVVLVDQPQTTYTHSALTSLAESDAALVICGSNHLPTAILLPLSEHSQVVWRVSEQIAASEPLRKRLWQQLVTAKIRAQAGNLDAALPARKKLLALAALVRSGDPTNIEAQAAKLYWQHWLGEEAFRRDTDGEGLNSLLNYGYAVLRAAVARALVAAGLLPSLGLHHCNRSNAFCLADDLMEPLRPLVDDRARELWRMGYDTITPEAKAELLKLLAVDVRFGDETGPLMVSLHRFAASLVKCFQGESRRLEIPEVCT
jgi:CRISPR-associated protein Cas1